MTEEGKPKVPVVTVKKLTRVERGVKSYPGILCDGPAPAKGKAVEFLMPNKTRYTGVVKDSITADGETFIELDDTGLTFVKEA